MKSSFKDALHFLLRLTVFLSLIVAATLIPVFSIYRYVIGLYLSRKYNTRITFLRGIDTFFAMDVPTTPFNNDGWQIYKGSCDIDKLRQRFEERWIRPREPDGRFKNIKLQQQLKKEFGYYFWIPQTDFRIENHVTLYDGPQLKNMKDFEKFLAKYTLDLPIEKGILWRAMLINLPDTFSTKVPEKQFMLLYNISHVLFDGVVGNRFSRKIFDDDDEKILYLPDKNRGDLIAEVSHWINVLFRGPLELICNLLTFEKHALFGPKLTGNKFVSISDFLDIQKVKVIKNYFKITVNDVIYSCVVGSFRRFMISEGQEIPSLMQFAVPVSLHSLKSEAKIDNNIAFGFIQIPINEVKCVERLRNTKKMLDDMKSSHGLYFSPLILTIFFNRFPTIFTRIVANLGSSAAIVSCMPLTMPKRLFGSEALQQFVILGTSNGISGCGINVTVSTEVNTFVCAFKADSGIVKSQDRLDKMVGFFCEELDELCRSCREQ